MKKLIPSLSFILSKRWSWFWFSLALPCSAIYAQETPVKVEHKGMVYVLENDQWVVTQGQGSANSIAVLQNGKWVIYRGLRVGSGGSLEVMKLGKWSRVTGQAVAVDDISYKLDKGRWIVDHGVRLTNGSEIQVYDSGVWVVKSDTNLGKGGEIQTAEKEKPVVVEKEKPTSAQGYKHYLGKLNCGWNDNEQSCFSHGCLWDDTGCITFSEARWGDRLSSADLALSVMRQRLFSAKTDLIHRYWINTGWEKQAWGYPAGIKFESLSNFFNWYGSNSFWAITADMTKRTSGDPTFPFGKLAPYQQAMNFYMLLAPKTTKATVLFRGLIPREKSCLEMIKQPRRFISTSWSRGGAEFFAGNEPGSCLLEIELPEGFPLFGICGSDRIPYGKCGEDEILLPSHILDTHGEIVPTSFDVVAQRTEGNRTVFNVKPINFLKPKNSSFQALEDFEKKYVKKVCEIAPQFSNDALIKMCAITKEVMHLPITSQENFALHPGIFGNYAKQCHDCALSGHSFACKCGDQDQEAHADLTSCATKNFDFDGHALRCNSEPAVKTSHNIPQGPYSKICGNVHFSEYSKSFIGDCLGATLLKLPECHDKQIAFWSNQERNYFIQREYLICVDKAPLPKGEYADCGCFVEHNEIKCACPYISYANKAARMSSLKLPCDGQIRIHHRGLVCDHDHSGL